jgi:hypothetical protein
MTLGLPVRTARTPTLTDSWPSPIRMIDSTMGLRRPPKSTFRVHALLIAFVACPTADGKPQFQKEDVLSHHKKHSVPIKLCSHERVPVQSFAGPLYLLARFISQSGKDALKRHRGLGFNVTRVPVPQVETPAVISSLTSDLGDQFFSRFALFLLLTRCLPTSLRFAFMPSVILRRIS